MFRTSLVSVHYRNTISKLIIIGTMANGLFHFLSVPPMEDTVSSTWGKVFEFVIPWIFFKLGCLP